MPSASASTCGAPDERTAWIVSLVMAFVVAPFRIRSGPLLIPWSEVGAPAPTPGLAAFVTLELPAARTSLRIPEEAAAQLLQRRR